MSLPRLIVATANNPFADENIHQGPTHPLAFLVQHAGGLVVCPASFDGKKDEAPAWLAKSQKRGAEVKMIVEESLSLAGSKVPLVLCDAKLARLTIEKSPNTPFLFAPPSDTLLADLSSFEFNKVEKQIHRVVTSSCVQHLYFLERLKFPADRIELIPDSIDASYFSPDPQISRSHSTIAVPWFKGMDLDILERSGLRHEAEVVLLVSTQDTKKIVRSPTGVKIQEADVSQQRDFMRRAGAVVIPSSQQETSCGATRLLESMAIGVPTVLANSRGLEHLIIPEHEALVYTMEDPGTLRSQVHRLLSDVEFAATISSNMRAKVLASMTNRHFAERFLRLLHKSADESPEFYFIPAHLRPTSRGVA